MLKKLLLTSTILTLSASASAFAASSTTDRLNQLEQEIKLLKRQQEVKEEKEIAAAEKAAIVEYGKKGLSITSPDKSSSLALHGVFQVDSRNFIDGTGKDDLLARRLRPILDVKFRDASFRLMPDFAGSTTRIVDGYVEYKLADPLQLRFGKFKTPIGLEQLQSDPDTFFIERGHPSNLVPNRDIGFMVFGNLVPDVLEYQLGVFNGNQDAGNTDGDDDSKKDIAARIFAQPFHNSDMVVLQGLGVGIGGSIGDREGAASKTILGTYKSPGQQDFFKYRSDTYADGEQWRLAPQAYWYYGNKGLIAEYTISDQEVTRGANHADLRHDAWQVAASYILTGEDANFRGGVKPFKDVNFKEGGMGAWELIARVGATDVDNKTFGNFADPNVAATKAQSYGGGVSWYLSENLKLALAYDFTTFDGGAAGGTDQPDEQALFARTQFRF